MKQHIILPTEAKVGETVTLELHYVVIGAVTRAHIAGGAPYLSIDNIAWPITADYAKDGTLTVTLSRVEYTVEDKFLQLAPLTKFRLDDHPTVYLKLDESHIWDQGATAIEYPEGLLYYATDLEVVA